MTFADFQDVWHSQPATGKKQPGRNAATLQINPVKPLGGTQKSAKGKALRDRIKVGRLSITADGDVTIDRVPVHTTKDQRKILLALVANTNNLVTRQSLARHTNRSPENLQFSRSLDVAVSRLRKVLGPEGWRIRSVPSAGYLFDNRPSENSPTL